MCLETALVDSVKGITANFLTVTSTEMVTSELVQTNVNQGETVNNNNELPDEEEETIEHHSVDEIDGQVISTSAERKYQKKVHITGNFRNRISSKFHNKRIQAISVSLCRVRFAAFPSFILCDNRNFGKLIVEFETGYRMEVQTIYHTYRTNSMRTILTLFNNQFPGSLLARTTLLPISWRERPSYGLAKTTPTLL